MILRVELETFEGEVKYAEYNNFRIGNEKEHYQLDIGAYSGNAGEYII